MPVTRCERPHWSQIRLRDRTDFFQLLARLNLARPGRLVKRLSTVRLDAIREWVQRVLPAVDSPLTACSTFLFDRLLHVSNGDLGLARLITGHGHAHSESVAHYAHYDAGVLWDAYWQAWTRTPIAYGNRKGLGHGVHVPERDTRHGYGARRVPTVNSIKCLLDRLRQRIRLANGADRHNYYTAYTWIGLVLGTGMRPVTDPHVYPIAGGMASQDVATFIDKARSNYHRRVNVIPPALLKHLDRYTHHLRDLDRESYARRGAETLAFRYCSPETKRYRAFRPGDFEALCSSDFDLELYALRRFVRTELAHHAEIASVRARSDGLRVTPEDIDAFMGHWYDGLSPHDPLSTYPTMRLQAVAQAASELLHAVSFKPRWIDQGRC